MLCSLLLIGWYKDEVDELMMDMIGATTARPNTITIVAEVIQRLGEGTDTARGVSEQRQSGRL